MAGRFRLSDRYRQGLQPLAEPRLAIVRFAKWSRAEPEQQKVFDAAIAKLRDAGAVLEELELGELDHANWDTINTILASEGALIFGDLVERYPDRTSDHLKSLVKTGKAYPPTTILPPRRCRTNCASRFPTRFPASTPC